MCCDYYKYTYITTYSNNGKSSRKEEICRAGYWFTSYDTDEFGLKLPSRPPQIIYKKGAWIRPEYSSLYKSYLKNNVYRIVKSYVYVLNRAPLGRLKVSPTERNVRELTD